MNSIEAIEALEKKKIEKLLKWGIDKESIEKNRSSIKKVSEEQRDELGKKIADIIMKRDYNEESEEFDEVLKYIKEGANLNYKNSNKKGFFSLGYCARYGYAKTFITLIKYGADVNLTNDFGTTPLMSACVHNYFEMVEMLILLGADVNARCKDGDTPLICAKKHSSKESFDLLIAANAMIGQKNICNKTSADYHDDIINEEKYISKENISSVKMTTEEDLTDLIEEAKEKLKKVNIVLEEPKKELKLNGFKRIS